MNYYETIVKIEKEFDVHRLRYDSFYVWPILKSRLLFNAIYSNSNSKAEVNAGSDNSKRTNRYFSFLLSLYNSIKGILSLNLFIYKTCKDYKKKKIKFLVLDVGNICYVDYDKGKRYSRYLSPYFEYLNIRGGALLLNLSKEKNITNKSTQCYYYNMQNFRTYRQLKYRISLLRNKSEIKKNNLDEINSYLDTINYPVKVDILNLHYYLEEVKMYTKIYFKILKRTRPSAVFFGCFYGNPSYDGLTLAAKKLGIKVVDIQHGVSAFDTMYLGWDHAPSGGFDLLPDYFWVWSAQDVKEVLDSRGSSIQLQPVLGGNLWYKKFKEEQHPSESDVLLSKLKGKFKKTILVCLDHSRPLDEFIIEAIEKGKDWLWLVRFHPLDQKDPGYRDRYIERLKIFENVNYSESTNGSLYHVLSLSSYAITYYSTVSFEALTFRVPSMIMGGIKFKPYEPLEKQGCLAYVDSSAEILDILENDRLSVNHDIYESSRLRFEDHMIENALKIIDTKCAE